MSRRRRVEHHLMITEHCTDYPVPAENTNCRTMEYPGNRVATGTPSLCDKRPMRAATTASAISDTTCGSNTKKHQGRCTPTPANTVS